MRNFRGEFPRCGYIEATKYGKTGVLVGKNWNEKIEVTLCDGKKVRNCNVGTLEIISWTDLQNYVVLFPV